MSDDEFGSHICPECDGYHHLYAMAWGTPCPGCGQGDPTIRGVITSSPEEAHAILDAWHDDE